LRAEMRAAAFIRVGPVRAFAEQSGDVGARWLRCPGNDVAVVAPRCLHQFLYPLHFPAREAQDADTHLLALTGGEQRAGAIPVGFREPAVDFAEDVRAEFHADYRSERIRLHPVQDFYPTAGGRMMKASARRR